MKIAIATKSGTEIDQHFGHAERFLIYDYSNDSYEQVDEVSVDKYCQFDPDNPFRHRQFDGIVKALSGCQAVVTAMIGQLPREELLKAGILPVTTSAEIAPALKLANDLVEKYQETK